MSNPIRDEWRSPDGSVRLILGDCLDVLPTLSGIDAIVTDPPYGIQLKTENEARGRGIRQRTRSTERWNWQAKDHPPVRGDDKPFDPRPLLTIGRNHVLWGANNYASRLPDSPCWLAWDRKCGKAAESDLGDCELAAVLSVSWKAVRIFRHMWAGYQRDSEVGEGSLHPTQKPIALMEWCLGFVAGETVADPYMGSGTTGVACVRKGRRFVGIECERPYWEIAVCRVRAELDRFPLFEPQKPRQLELLAGEDP